MQQASTPAIRAVLVHGLVDSIESLPQGPEVLARVQADCLERLRSTEAGRWLSFEDHGQLLRALWEVSGEVGFKAHYRRFVYDAVETPLLAPVFNAAIASFGRDPRTLFRLYPKACGLTTRGVGESAVRLDGEDALCIEWSELCPDARTDPWVALQEATCVGLVDLCHGTAQAQADTSRIDEGRVDVHVRWRLERPTPVPSWLSVR